MVFVVFVKDISNFQHRIPIDSFLQTSVTLGGISTISMESSQKGFLWSILILLNPSRV